LRRLLAILAAGGALAALTGCDSGPPVSQTRDLGGFTRLEVSGDLSLDIRLFNRPDPGVRITAGTKAIDRIKTEVVGDVLRVSTKSRGLTIGPDPLGDVQISLGIPALLALRVDDQADVTLSGLSAKSFELRVDGSGDVRARGRVDELEMEVDGSATTDLSDLSTQDASVRIDGSGDADLRVARSLELIVEGSGDVTYRGRPSVSSRLEGSGNVRQLDD
jgi:putative autotransporter adhesin-like protein